MNRFVIQKHTEGGGAHSDFMLEAGDCLQTWRLDKEPEQILNAPAEAEKIFDHPLKFLTYQGPVNNGKGNVQIIEKGTYEISAQENDKIEINLNGKTLQGNFTLTRIKDDKWQFVKSTRQP